MASFDEALASSWAGITAPAQWGDRLHSVGRPLRTKLAAAVTATATSITVATVLDRPGKHVIRIGDEQLFVTAGMGTASLTVVRGVNGTFAAAHGTGDAVLTDSVTRVLLVGDSTVEGVTGGNLAANLIRRLERTLNLPNLGVPEGSGGWYPVYRTADTDIGGGTGNTATEWSATGAWSQPTSGGANDRMLWRWNAYSTGVGSVLTWTAPANLGPIQQIDVYFTEMIGNAWSYSVDGGVTWTDGAGSGASEANGTMCRASIAVNNPPELRIRAATALGTPSMVRICGVFVHAVPVDFGFTQGIELYNAGKDGDTLAVLDRANPSGDSYAFLDGYQGSIFPALVIAGPFTNDVVGGTAPSFQADLGNLLARAKTFAELIVCCMGEQSAALRPIATQAAFRAAAHAAAAARDAAVVDLYAAWAETEGAAGYAAAVAGGLMADTLHPSERGQRDFAGRLGRLIDMA